MAIFKGYYNSYSYTMYISQYFSESLEAQGQDNLEWKSSENQHSTGGLMGN